MSSIKIEEVKRNLVYAIAIMDEDGKLNPESNSRMLWLKSWGLVRLAMVDGINLCNQVLDKDMPDGKEIIKDIDSSLVERVEAKYLETKLDD